MSNLIPVGTYVARAVDAKLSTSKAGNAMVTIMYEITEGELVGKIAYFTGAFTEKAKKYAVEALKLSGWNPEDGLEGFAEGGLPSGFGEPEVKIVIQHEKDDKGVDRARVRFVNPLKGGLAPKNVLDNDQLRALAADLGLAPTGAAPKPLF